MPIDTSIYNQLKPVQIENPLAQYAQLAQVQSAQNQNRLADLTFGEKQREVAGENALAGLVSSGKKGDEVFTGLAGQGYGKQAMAYRKQEADRVKADAELKGLNLGNQGKEFELGEKKRIAGIQKNAALLTNPNFSYDMFVNHVQQSVANKEVAPEAAQAFIQQAPQDPTQLKAFLTQQLLSSLSPEKQLEATQPKTEFKDTGGQIVGIQNNPNLPGYGKPIQGADLKKTQSPDSVASVNATLRGQDLTDARGRDSNAISRERLNVEKAQPKGQYDAERGLLVDPRTGVAKPVIGPDGAPLGGKDKMTEDQGKATGWLVQAQNAFNNMNDAIKSKPSAAKPGFPDVVAGIPSMGIGGAVGNMMRGTDRQKFLQGSSSLSESLLRAATGAGVNKDEAAQKVRELTPVFGDSDETINQKMAAIPLYIESLKVRAGPGAKKAVAIVNAAKAPNIDDLLKKYGD